MNDVPPLPDLAAVARPGDVIVVSYRDRLDMATLDAMRQTWSEHVELAGVKLVILEGTDNMVVVTGDDREGGSR